MSLDERLLQKNRPASAEAAAGVRSGDLRRMRRAGGNEGQDGQPGTLRQRVMGARKEKAAKESSAQKLASVVTSPVRKSTSRLLRTAWYNIIDSYGATLIWINIHFFLSAVLGEKLFCKPGQEWTDAVGDKAGGGKTAEQLEMAQKAIGTVEKGLLGCVNAVIFFVIFFIVVVVYIIIDHTAWVVYKAIEEIVL